MNALKFTIYVSTMKAEEIDACWKDPRNRKWGFCYCKADPRAIVPRHFRWMGWTINAARPSAIPVLLCLLTLLTVPAAIVRANGGSAVTSFVTIAASIAAVSLLCSYLSSSQRWSR